jgi:NAD(P)-dependent dehydrogenase (short-subunit alcohol dehydrogenase family)
VGEDFPPPFFMSTYKNLIVGSRSGLGLALKNKLNGENKEVIHIFRNSDEENIIDLAKKYKDEKIKNIYYCLGTITLKSVLSTTSNQLIEDYKVNLVYAHEIIKLFLRELINNDGSVIFYSSVAAKMGLSFHSSVASSKSAVEGYVKSLSAELAGKIRVNAIRLSLLDTPLSKFIFDNEKSREISKNMQPTNSFININDVVSMSLEIAQNKSITGQIITIDGGMTSLFKKHKL